MNRRISKNMAYEAAKSIADAKFRDKLNEETEILNKYCELLVRKYVPYPVRAVLAEYPSYFRTVRYCNIFAYQETDHGPVALSFIQGEISFNLPGSKYSVACNLEEYNHLRELYVKCRNIKNKMIDFRHDVEDAINDLKYEKKVEDTLPEVLKYIPFPSNAQVPAKNYDDLAKKIKGL